AGDRGRPGRPDGGLRRVRRDRGRVLPVRGRDRGRPELALGVVPPLASARRVGAADGARALRGGVRRRGGRDPVRRRGADDAGLAAARRLGRPRGGARRRHGSVRAARDGPRLLGAAAGRPPAREPPLPPPLLRRRPLARAGATAGRRRARVALAADEGALGRAARRRRGSVAVAAVGRPRRPRRALRPARGPRLPARRGQAVPVSPARGGGSPRAASCRRLRGFADVGADLHGARPQDPGAVRVLGRLVGDQGGAGPRLRGRARAPAQLEAVATPRGPPAAARRPPRRAGPGGAPGPPRARRALTAPARAAGTGALLQNRGLMHDVDGVNAGYARLLLDEYLDNPESVPPEWRALFESGEAEVVRGLPGIARLLERAAANGGPNGHGNGEVAVAEAVRPSPAEADRELVGAVAAAMALVKAHRMHGHLAARLDPLGSEPLGDPALDPLRLEPRLTLELQRRIPASVLRVHVEGETLADALPRLRETYCGSMAYEIEHISEHEQRVWLRQAIESWRYRQPLSSDEQRRLYTRLCEVEGMERYLRRSFLGQKQFSLEGVDVTIPMLDEALELAAAGGAREVVIGMAHRGRLNVLAHTIGMPYEKILREFEGERMLDVVAADAEGGTGDVKYHLGAAGVRATAAGKLAVTLAANPSHLEAVDPVVEGMTRALQTDRSAGAGIHDPSVAMPILLHGDAAFAGQGVVAETLNLYALEGYSTGGTLHIITDNQVGFTTDPSEERSTRHSSDLAKGFDTPIVHVNADDPEAAIAAVRLALAYRARFGHDVVVDLVGYRRFGHNEQDEAAYTQPLMVDQIAAHPTVRELYGARLVEQGVLTADEAEEIAAAAEASLREAHERLRATFGQDIPPKSREERVPRDGTREIETRVPAAQLRALTEELLRVPDGFR